MVVVKLLTERRSVDPDIWNAGCSALLLWLGRDGLKLTGCPLGKISTLLFLTWPMLFSDEVVSGLENLKGSSNSLCSLPPLEIDK